MDNITRIRALEMGDIPQVAEIFGEQFPKSPWTQLGQKYTRKAFLWHYENFPRLAMVSETDSKVTGFIVGARYGNRECYQRIARFAYKEFFSGLARRPWLIFNRLYFSQLGDVFKSPRPVNNGLSVNDPEKIAGNKAILTFVAVNKAGQGKGIGTCLLKAFEQAALQQGFEILSLYTELDNHPARSLYVKNGWVVSHTNPRRNMIYYSKRLSRL